MQSSVKTALCLFFIAGFTHSTEAARPVTRNVGQYLETAILTLSDNVVKCSLFTPRGEEIEFKPENNSNEKYELLEDTDFVQCQVRVRDLDSSDSGIWTLRSESDTGTERTESYQLTVNSEEATTESANPDDIKTTEEIPNEILTTDTADVKTTPGLEETTAQPETTIIADTTTIKDEDWTVVNIEPKYIKTKLGETHRVVIPEYDFLNNEKCYIVKPDGNQHDFQDMHISEVEVINDYTVACGVKVFIASEEMTGTWTLISRGTRFSTEIVERRLPFTITLEETSSTENIKTTEESFQDTTNGVIKTTVAEFTKKPTENTETTPEIMETTTMKLEDVIYIDIDPGHFIKKIGDTLRVTIPEYDFLNSDDCYIVTPSDERHDIDNLHIYGIEAINDYNVACGIKIHILSENLVGNWTLISRGTRFSTEIVERRLPFTIILEEIVDALPSEITIMEGNDIYIRLNSSTTLYDTCKLVDNYNQERVDVEKDTRYVDTCGFIVRNANISDSGFWKITFGIKTIYNAWTRVTVNGNSDAPSAQTHYTWTLDAPVTQLLGPESTVYCKVVDANQNTVFDGFGRCNVTLSRVTNEHAGAWKMFVGLQGRVLTDEHDIQVSVRRADSKPVVSTTVSTDKPLVTLTCSVTSPQAVRSCKFRDPSGRILIASPGVGEDRYTFHGSGASYSSGVHHHECGIQIRDPVVRDLGLWRCAMETENENYYGFLAALCPWAMRDPVVAANVRSEPVLEAESEIVDGLAGEHVTMSCSVEAPIRYCYFRARNGTTFSISPGETSGVAEYAGAGFDAGECSIRFSNLLPTDSGRWSCHVGFVNQAEAEQSAQFQLTVQDTLVAEQRVDHGALLVTGRVYNDRAVEYCRFVRIDGLGFTTANLPEEYRSNSLLSVGRCEIQIRNPSILEMHPWTVAVRVHGMDREFFRQTTHSIQMPGPGGDANEASYGFPLAWVFVIVIGLSLIIVGILVVPKRNRNWTYSKATIIRDSFRRSFTRKNVSEQNVQEKTTPMSA